MSDLGITVLLPAYYPYTCSVTPHQNPDNEGVEDTVRMWTPDKLLHLYLLDLKIRRQRCKDLEEAITLLCRAEGLSCDLEKCEPIP